MQDGLGEKDQLPLRNCGERECSPGGRRELDLKDHAEVALASLSAATENGMLKVQFSWQPNYLHTGGTLSSHGGRLVTKARPSSPAPADGLEVTVAF